MLTKPWEQPESPWKTEGAFWSWLRGGLRLGLWNKNPIKLQFIKDNRKRIKNPRPNPSVNRAMVWGGTCALCRTDCVQQDLEVDHIHGNHSLRTFEDVIYFVQNIAFVTAKDLQLVCKSCHKAKSYSEKTGIDFEAARIEKQAIAITKTIDTTLAYLNEQNYNGPMPSNAKKRRDLVRELLQNKE